MRTLSPSSKARLARLELLSLCLLSGRAYEGVFGRDEEATDDGRVDELKGAVDGESDDADEMSLARLFLCCDGSLALMASAKALDMASTSCWDWLTGTLWPADDDERERPGIPLGLPGVGIPDCLGLDMVDSWN